jgi:precorrin-2 dehydrogenase/sirohydrochlorin ferrochelatase
VQVFPVFLDLAHRPCLVVGGGEVGREKAASLAAAGADVLVVDPSPSRSTLSLAETESRVAVDLRPFREDDCAGRRLVFACTDDEAVNAAVLRASSDRGVLCCRADAGGDFSTGALLRRGDLCVAVSSGGTSPALAIEARDRAAAAIGEEFGKAAELLGQLRERLRGAVPDASARVAALRGTLVAAVLEALRDGDDDGARALVDEAFDSARRAAGDSHRSAKANPCTR